MPTSVVLDTNVFGAILATDGTVDEFTALLNQSTFVINIPDFVMWECIAEAWETKTGVGGTKNRLLQIRRLVSGVRNKSQLQFNKAFRLIIKVETQRPNRKDRKIPSVRDITKTILIGGNLASAYLEAQESINKQKESKMDLVEKDRDARRKKLIPHEEAVEMATKFKEKGTRVELGPFLLDQCRNYGLGISGVKFRKIIKSSRYPVINALLDLLAFHHLSVFIKTNEAPLEIRNLLALDRNDRVDVFIAATAGNCKYFVTKDEKLANRCNYLNKDEVLGFETITYSTLKQKMNSRGARN